MKDKGFELLQRAIDLDPGNPRWKEALESAKAEPERQRNYRQMTNTATAPSDARRIGGAVAEANLVTRVEPQYPPLALVARIQGSVEFTVTIGADGHVQNIQLVRGHPLLVTAALEAVRQWVYRPTLLNGQAVPVVTDVLVPFRLPQ
jgi:TonB family protein